MTQAAIRQVPTTPAPAPAPAHPLLAHVDRLMQDLHVRVPAALNEWDVEGVHQARVATRRLKAALDLMKPVLGRKRRQPLARLLRKLRRRLGPLRDADVMIGHLEELAAANPKHADAAQWLVRHIARERDALREASRDDAPAARVLQELGTWHPVREQFNAGREAVPTLLAASLHRQLDAFVAEAGQVVATLQSPPDGDAADASTRPDPHELRIAGKALRYTLEMAVAAGHDLPPSVLKTFKAMQEHLGAWHDFVVLTDKSMSASIAQTLSHRDASTQEKVLNLACFTLRRSAKELQQFGKTWTAKGPALAETIRGAFPVEAPGPAAGQASESKTGHGPPGSEPPAGPAGAPPDGPSAAP